MPIHTGKEVTRAWPYSSHPSTNYSKTSMTSRLTAPMTPMAGSATLRTHPVRRTIDNPDESGNTSREDSDNIDEVHAIDVDKNLKADVTMENCVQDILDRCRTGEERRLNYIIYNRRIWELSNDWRERDYTGSNPHDHHAHFSGSYESDKEADRSPWFGDLMGLSSDDKKYIDQTIAKYVGDVVGRWTREGNHVPDDDANPNQTMASAAYYAGADGAHSRYVQLAKLQTSIDQLAAKVDEMGQR